MTATTLDFSKGTEYFPVTPCFSAHEQVDVRDLAPTSTGIKLSYLSNLPSNIDITSSTILKVGKIKNDSVRSQVQVLLSGIVECLHCYFRDVSNRLPKLLLSEREDMSALIEWNFEKFRVGFSLEPDKSESYCYFVENDKTAGRMRSESSRLPENYDVIIKSILSFAIQNS